MLKKILLLILLFPFQFFSQTKNDSIWIPFNYFTGSWSGEGEGLPGKGTYTRSYNFIFNNKFIEIKNKAVYLPTENNSQGEVHEDLGYLSYDKLNKTFKLRQLHIEGFVNQYKLDPLSSDGKTIVFISESIENIKEGWRAKETYIINNENEFTEIFELADQEKPFEVYIKVTFKRQ